MTKKPAAPVTAIKPDAVQPASETASMVPGTPYAQLVAEASVIATSFSNKCMDFYWHLGAKANELTKTPDKYGNRKLINFMTDVERTCKYSLGKSSYYNAMAVNTYMTKAQLEIAREAKISVMRLVSICNNKLTNEQRQAILLEAKNHQGPQVFDVKEAAQKAIAEATGGEVKTTPEKPEPVDKQSKRILKGAEKLILAMSSKLKLVGDAVETICKGGDKDAMDVAYEQWDAASIEFDAMHDMWQKQIAKATKAFDKVKTVLKK